MRSRGFEPLETWPGPVKRRWRGLHVGTDTDPGCLDETSPTYHSVAAHGQGVRFNCGPRGYSTSKPVIFYLVRNRGIVKCGIANPRNFTRRVKAAAELEWAYLVGFLDGMSPWSLEVRWKSFRLEWAQLHLSRAELCDGYTEAMRINTRVDPFLEKLVACLQADSSATPCRQRDVELLLSEGTQLVAELALSGWPPRIELRVYVLRAHRHNHTFPRVRRNYGLQYLHLDLRHRCCSELVELESQSSTGR
jgi:hypothetical protein